ncbi:MAG: dihydrofolate reductase family protein [Acidimicrobiales bacterium]
MFSKTLAEAGWQNSTLVSGDAAEAVAERKAPPGQDLALFGSPTLTASLLEAGVVDELRVMIHPVLLGAGRSLFDTLEHGVPLRLVHSTTFSSGNVLLTYDPPPVDGGRGRRALADDDAVC